MLRSLARLRPSPGLLQLTEAGAAGPVEARPAAVPQLLRALQRSTEVSQQRGLAVPLGAFYTNLGPLG
eukprot:Skav224939  [mRNA]  locus=scaffold1474:40651:41901:- [translate_table: standard]